MDSTMTIRVQVMGRQAIAQLDGVSKAVTGVSNAASGGAAKSTGQFFSVLNNNLVKAGKNLQWVGRQLTFNFTLPLVAAGVALFKTNQDIARSMTEVVKVYGDASFTQQRVKEETDALAISFELLSTRFGENQAAVIDIAAAWAQAGSAGSGLAENTRATLETMVLGQMDATQATQGLIAIQATWGLSTMAAAGHTSELHDALANLNVIENQTGIEFSGLIDVMTRAGGAARTSGMSIRELASFAAALVPATGSAAQAGNSLRTMISRLQSPTKETANILGQMGINVNSVEWGSKTATEKIIDLSKAFQGLDQAAQNQVSSIIASRWQINRFSVLMRDVASNTGYFNKAMEATADQAAANQKYQEELMTFLESSPKKWDIMTQAIRNSMAKAFLPLMPVIMNVIGMIARLADWFAALPKSTQKWVMIGAALLAIVGPIMQLAGAFSEFFGMFYYLGKSMSVFLLKAIIVPIESMILALASGLASLFGASAAAAGAAITEAAIATGAATEAQLAAAAAEAAAAEAIAAAAAVSAPLWAIVAVIAAIVVAIIAIFNSGFRDAIWNAIKSVGQAFAWLPGVIVKVFNAIIRIIQRAIEIIVEALSYLNPFARHSPSLVDNVTAGVATILDQYAKFNKIPALISSAVRALDKFSTAAAPGAKNAQEAELQGYLTEIKRGNPAAAPAASAMIPIIMNLQAQLAPLAKEIEHQSIVVAKWTEKLKEADAVLLAAQKELDKTSKEFNKVADQIAAAQGRIDELANTPLNGMKAMEDHLFDITMQQNQLNLQLVEFEKQGMTIDSIREKYAALNGQVELLRGEQSDLQAAGAGSDILSVYDDQIQAVEEQRKSMGGVEKQILDIQNALDDLDLEARFTQLTQSITFDPLIKQIKDMVDTTKEMSFDDVVAGIKEQQTLIAQLQPQYDALQESMDAQTAAVEAAQAARDAIAEKLDAEQAKLDGLNDAYSAIKDMINDMTDAMRGFADASKAAADAAAAAGGGGGAGGDGLAVGDYPIQGGGSQLGPEGGLADIEAFNAELDKELQGVLEGMGGLDIFGSLKDAWNSALEWLKGVWNGALEWIKKVWDGFVGWLGKAWTQIRSSGFVQGVINVFNGIVSWFTVTFIPFFQRMWQTIQGYAQTALDWFNEHVAPTFQAMGEFIMAVWLTIAPVVEAAWGIIVDIIKTALEVIGIILDEGLDIIKVIWSTAWGIITETFSLVWETIWGILQIAWGFIRTIIESGLKIIRGLFQFFTGLLTGDWDKAWQGIKNILAGVWDAMLAVVRLVWEAIKLAIKVGWDAIMLVWHTGIALFKGAWDVVWDGIKLVAKVAWTIIEGTVRNLVNGIKGIIEGATGMISRVWHAIWDGLTGAVSTAWDKIKGFVQNIVDFVKDKIDWVKDAVSGNIGGGADTPWVPWARGGVVRQPTFGVVGEAGPEVVIPLTDPRRAIELVRQSGLMNLVLHAQNKMTPQQSAASMGSTSTSSVTVININGNLEFPSISNGEDASKFVANLKVIAS